MTREEIYEILKRYPYIYDAVKRNKASAQFYIGKRKYEIKISNEIKVLFEIVEDIESSASGTYEKVLIDGLKKGKKDISVMRNIPYSRSSYYSKKQGLIEKIYECSISKGLVDYDDILKSG